MSKKEIKDYTVVTIASFILAIAFNASYLPFEIVTGGSSGLSIIANHFFGISPSIVVFICYFFALIVGFFVLGKKEIKNSIYGSFIYPIFISITSPMTEYVKSLSLDTSDYLVIVIIGAAISGIAYGLVYKIGYTTGGSDIASQIFSKYFGASIGSSNMIINSIIVISGGAIFGWTKVLYSILALYIVGLATDKVTLGISFSKSFYIITDKEKEVKQYISNEFNQKITELDATGGYTNQGQHVLMCVVPTNNYYRLKEGINIIDKEAFFVIMDAYELESR